MKWEKLGKTYEEWCESVLADDCKFAITKVDHPSKYRGYQRMSYQMIQSLPNVNKTNIGDLCADTVKYVNSLKNKNNVEMFLDFLEINKSELNANQMYIDLVKQNPQFVESEVFCKFRTKTIFDYKKQLRAGKLLQNADNLTVCGNPYLLLLHAVGDLKKYINKGKLEGFVDPTLPLLESGVSVYTKRFSKNEQLAGFRNPHNSPNNILYLVNTGYGNDLLESYFNFSKNIIAINMVQTDVQDRANSMDEDSDFIYCCNSDLIVQSSIHAQEFLTIVNTIPQSKKTYNNTLQDRAIIDSGLAKGKYDIGLTSNLAAIALSWYWKAKTDIKKIPYREYCIRKLKDQRYKGKIICCDNVKKSKDLSEVVAICSVLAQVAIDNSKRKYEVNISSEIKRIRNLPCMQVKKQVIIVKDNVKVTKLVTAKPYFWQFVKDITESNKKTDDLTLEEKIKLECEKQNKKKEKMDDIIVHCLNEKLCPMDFIQEEIDKIKSAWSNKKSIDDMEFVVKVDGKAEHKQIKKILPIVNELDDFYKENKNKDKENTTDDEKWLIEQRIKVDDIMSKLKKYTPTKKTMQMLIISAFKENKHYKQRLLNCLYNLSPNKFLACFKEKL